MHCVFQTEHVHGKQAPERNERRAEVLRDARVALQYGQRETSAAETVAG